MGRTEWWGLMGGGIGGVACSEIVEALQEMGLGEAAGPSGVGMVMVVAGGKMGVKVVVELCQHVLDGVGVPDG